MPLDFTDMSPAQAARLVAWKSDYDEAEQDILSAIHHFSNRNLNDARRYHRLKEILLHTTAYGKKLIDEIESIYPE